MRPLLPFFALFLFGTGYAAEANPKLNVVFILADDLGWADTTLYGHTHFYQTPNLERLAKRGMTFSRAYSASPLCSPTRSAILTGLSPARTGITTPNCHVPEVVLQATIGTAAAADQKSVQPKPVTRLKTEYRTLAESLKEAGYATGHFGKWHLGPEHYSPLQQGFDVDLPHHSGPGPAGSYVAPWKFKNFKERTPGEHLEDRMTAEATAWMEKNRDRPFYLNYWMFSVHAPFDAKMALIEKHRARVNPADPQRCPTYAAMVESMDDAVGTLLDTLDRLGIADRTVIVFTSDNGGNMYSDVEGEVPTSNTPLRGGKATMYEGGTRVPCVIAWPGLTEAGSRNEALIQSEDYYPSLLAGLGLAPRPDQHFDGISILPALKGGSLARPALFQYFPHNPAVPDWLPPSASVHAGDWKLIRLFHGGVNGAHRHLLFDLRKDIGERNDLSSHEPSRVVELDGLLEKFLGETHAVVPVPNPAFDAKKYRPELEGKADREGKKAVKTAEQAKDEGDSALQGWKARACTAIVKKGVLYITEGADFPFLGYAANKQGGKTTVTFRIRAAKGDSHIDWLPGGVSSTANRANFMIPGDEWQTITVSLPSSGPLGLVRLYLPRQATPIEIDWIEISSEQGGTPARADF